MIKRVFFQNIAAFTNVVIPGGRFGSGENGVPFIAFELYQFRGKVQFRFLCVARDQDYEQACGNLLHDP
jgi:hypothetical protein